MKNESASEKARKRAKERWSDPKFKQSMKDTHQKYAIADKPI